ncbi:hypothetical protein EQW78_11845 [Oerskovia turbata]|uniref:Uncharacterized protein n=1 Tax=Oerskovia turbata TaxID=1713 RepID=A0A4Q1KU13_9CELL|nr:hypothetical protein EQW73_09500 [Oerskovia turbata]RXR33175.1 hypothetical protein EQW78_11845 [Oerskovia turbata]
MRTCWCAGTGRRTRGSSVLELARPRRDRRRLGAGRRDRRADRQGRTAVPDPVRGARGRGRAGRHRERRRPLPFARRGVTAA